MSNTTVAKVGGKQSRKHGGGRRRVFRATTAKTVKPVPIYKCVQSKLTK